MQANREATLELLNEHVSIIATKGPLEKLGESFEEAEKCFQAIACCNLLLTADSELFRRHLVWGAFTRRRFQVRCRDEGVADFRLARSRSDAVFCSLAAADLVLAREISDASPTSWIPDGEYEDDFAYHTTLHHLMSSADTAAVQGALERFATALGDLSSRRLDVCRALYDRDVVTFREALRILAEETEQEMAEARPDRTDDPTFAPRSHIFIEGLALIRLAVELSLPVGDAEYPLCPSIARLLPSGVRPEDVIIEAENA